MTDFDFKKPAQKITNSEIEEAVKTHEETDKITQPEQIENTTKLFNNEPEADINQHTNKVRNINAANFSGFAVPVKSKDSFQTANNEPMSAIEKDVELREEILKKSKDEPEAIANVVNKKNESVYTRKSIIIVLLLIFIILGGLGFGIFLAQDKLAFWKQTNTQVQESIYEQSIGTFVAFEEGKIKENTIGEDVKTYKNELFPEFEASSFNGNVWRVTESDKSKGNQIKYDLILKKNDVNIIFSFYTDNGGLNNDTICLKKDDTKPINSFWNIENRLNEVYKEKIGYYFMPAISYISKGDALFDLKYSAYNEFIDKYTKDKILKEDAQYCSTSQRVIRTKTSKEQTKVYNTENKVLLRIFTPKVELTETEFKEVSELIATIKF